MRFLYPLSWLLLVAVSASATAADLVEGRDYVRLEEAQPPQGPVRLEVVEFFSYACPHCYRLHPLIRDWAAALPKDVSFVRIPVSLGRREWGPLVRTYYALQATGDLERLEGAFFDAIHAGSQPLFDERAITDWVSRHGVDAKKFSAAFNSFGVTSKASRAEQLSRDYRIDGVPFIAVAGQYVVRGATQEQMLDIARQLVDRARGE
jgi:thiol:disulfide interchange protein DsbA